MQKRNYVLINIKSHLFGAGLIQFHNFGRFIQTCILCKFADSVTYAMQPILAFYIFPLTQEKGTQRYVI